jgi:3-phenylpropionate/trans-cinnamate dioxygenase ferredoxin reductase component
MNRRTRMLIVGAGLAGAKAAEALRDQGFDGYISLVGSEEHRPYDRPPLSKEYLQGNRAADDIYVHPEGWYAEHDVDLYPGTTVTAVDPAAQVALTGAGGRLRYDRLLIATGSSPRRLELPGADLDNVLYLRTKEHSDRIRGAFAPALRVVIVGGGWIGLETAAAARAAGAQVTVLARAETPLVGVLGRQVAQVFADLHREQGVDLRCGVVVSGLRPTAGGSSVGAVVLADGAEVAADVVIVGVGATPNDHLARDAGLHTANGIVVDAGLRTGDPDVFAAGDVANAYHPLLGRHLRVEHWANALHQPAVAADAMLGGDSVYERLPYFFTDQYDLGMEYTGLAEAEDLDHVVVRGDLESREFIAFWVRDQRVLAGMNVNVWGVDETIQRLIRSRRQVDLRRLADPDHSLDALVAEPRHA